MFEYAGLDPKILRDLNFSEVGEPGQDPLRALESLGGPSYSQVALLSTIPLLVNGLAAWILVPLSIAVGRRPVILFAGGMCWIGGIWAATSTGLKSHLIARCLQGLGGGTVDSIIPLIIQDFMFIHERNRAVGAINASGGFITMCLGIAR
jgi:MFS family permease